MAPKRTVTQRGEDIPVRPGVEAYEHFYAREFHVVAALAYVLSGQRALAEDLTQDAFMAAFHDWDRISGFDRPGAWVRRVVANRAVSVWRRRATEVRLLARLQGHGEESGDTGMDAEADEIWQAVRALPKRQAQSVALYYLEDLSVEAIGKILECSPGTVKTHLARGRERLKRDLATHGLEVSGDDD